jgi:hypothetical protein
MTKQGQIRLDEISTLTWYDEIGTMIGSCGDDTEETASRRLTGSTCRARYSHPLLILCIRSTSPPPDLSPVAEGPPAGGWKNVQQVSKRSRGVVNGSSILSIVD